MRNTYKKNKAFTLVEVVVGAAVFLVVATAAYSAYVSLFKLVDLSQYRILAIALANEQVEIARNMPYKDVGVVGSIPVGKIPHVQTLVRGGVTFIATTTVRSIDLAYDGTIGGSPNDISPADNKLLEVIVSCNGCRDMMEPIVISSRIAPKNLETASSNGALFIRVFDANGQPIQGADVHVVNVATTTTIVVDDVTDQNGMLQLVDLPPSSNAYRITVSKSGYSSDRTYPIGGVGNPNPSKTDATVLLQQVTQISFAIDKTSTLSISSVTPMCVSVPSIDFSLVGSKQIGENVPKYSQNLATNASGLLSIPSMEWDTYNISASDAGYDLAGINPLNPFSVNPDTDQELQFIMVPKDPDSLVVTVKDSVTQLPITDAVVELTDTGSYDESLTTGRGYINQTDWSVGSGQEYFSNPARYWTDDANVDVSTTTGDVLLRYAFGLFNANGTLESSTFDVGSPSNFYSLIWQPNDQPLLAGSESVKFQLASNATITPTTTWAFIGPDDTASSYYTSSNSPISPSHNGNQFIRYRAYLSTETATITPNISDASFTYTSDCVPPGQVIFNGLSSGDYTVNVSKAGYTPYSATVSVTGAWQEHQVILAP